MAAPLLRLEAGELTPHPRGWESVSRTNYSQGQGWVASHRAGLDSVGSLVMLEAFDLAVKSFRLCFRKISLTTDMKARGCWQTSGVIKRPRREGLAQARKKGMEQDLAYCQTRGGRWRGEGLQWCPGS